MHLLIYDSQIYWSIMMKELSVKFQHPPKCILDRSDKSKQGGSWFPGAVLNIAECCLYPVPFQNKTDNSVAIIWRDEGFDDLPINYVSVKELREQVM
jgi:Acetyl-coenzyme A synthetase N-terminus